MGATKEKKLFAGKYQLLGRIGEGGMCEVFRAQQIHLQRDVALKVLRRELAEEADERERFLREARTCAKLEHANIVQIFEVGEAGNRPYIAMEYVDGKSLKDLNDEGIHSKEASPLLAKWPLLWLRPMEKVFSIAT